MIPKLGQPDDSQTLIAALTILTAIAGWTRPTEAAEMAMGFRVGEVTQNSAIVWTRITREPSEIGMATGNRASVNRSKPSTCRRRLRLPIAKGRRREPRARFESIISAVDTPASRSVTPWTDVDR